MEVGTERSRPIVPRPPFARRPRGADGRRLFAAERHREHRDRRAGKSVRCTRAPRCANRSGDEPVDATVERERVQLTPLVLAERRELSDVRPQRGNRPEAQRRSGSRRCRSRRSPRTRTTRRDRGWRGPGTRTRRRSRTRHRRRGCIRRTARRHRAGGGLCSTFVPSMIAPAVVLSTRGRCRPGRRPLRTRPGPTSPIHRSPVARSNEYRHGLRSPYAQISGRAPGRSDERVVRRDRVAAPPAAATVGRAGRCAASCRAARRGSGRSRSGRRPLPPSPSPTYRYPSGPKARFPPLWFGNGWSTNRTRRRVGDIRTAALHAYSTTFVFPSRSV